MKKLIRKLRFSKKQKYNVVSAPDNLPDLRNTPPDNRNDKNVTLRDLNILNGIPLEIWAVVFSYLRQASLASLLRTCRTFLAIAESFLYRDIELHWSNYRPRVYFLLRTLIERPFLGLHVRSLKLWCLSSFRYLHTCELGGVDVSILAAYIRSMRFEPAGMWHEAASHINTEAIAAMILSLVPNVQDLGLSRYFVENPNFVASVLRHAASENSRWCSEEDVQPFAKLSVVKITGSVTERPPGKWDRLDVENLSEYIRLPALQAVECAIPASLVFALSDYRVVWPLTKLTCHTLGTDDLAKLLSFTPHLEVLDYRHPWPEKSIFNCTSMYKALLNVENSLRDLEIKCRHDGTRMYWLSTPSGIDGRFGSLRDFRKLHNLYIPWVLLTALCAPGLTKIADVLPRDLRTLTLGDDLATFLCNRGTDTRPLTRNAQLRDFLSGWKTHTPKLGCISVKGSWDFWKPEAVQDMKEMCRNAGIELIFIK